MPNDPRRGPSTKPSACLLFLFVLGGCATKNHGSLMGPSAKPSIALDDTPTLYAAPKAEDATATTADKEATCAAAHAEIEALDSGLDGPAEESAPNLEQPTGWEGTKDYGADLAKETVLGYVQPFIQTKRALFNDNEKERRRAEAVERGQIRRAYLLGFKDGAGC